MQSVNDTVIDRKLHVWRVLGKGRGFRCVLCGAVSHFATDDCTPERYERLTDEDRRLCPQGKAKGES